MKRILFLSGILAVTVAAAATAGPQADGGLVVPALGSPGDTTVVVRRVYEGPGPDFWGTNASPDGRYITQTHWDSGDLAVLDLLTGQKRRLTGKKDDGWVTSYAYSEMARFSPDGKRIAYSWYTEPGTYELRVINTDGTDPRVLARSGLRPGEPSPLEWWPDVHGWSPDGESILVTFYFGSGPGPDDAVEVTRVSAEDGSMEVLHRPDPGKERRFAALSPDGRFLAFDEDPLQRADRTPSEGDLDVFVMQVPSGSPVRVASGQSTDMLIGWTEDGDVLFYSDRGLTEGVWRVPLANGRAVGDPVQVAGDLWGMEPMSIAGETLFYGVTTQVPRIHIQPLDLEANRLAGTPTPVEPHMRRSRAAAWSPDGLRVVYWVAHRDRGGQVSGRLVLRSTTGGDPIDITPPDLNVAGRARWSRDGRGLFLEARPLDGSESGLYYYDLEDGTSEFIFRAPPEINMRTGEVSSDGSTAYLLGNASDGGEALIRVDVDTGEQRELLSHPARSDAAPGILGMGLSPDEQQLAVWDLSDPVGERSLLVLPTDGGEPRLLLKVTSREDELDAACRGYRAPIWTPDGRYVLTTFRNVPAGQSIPPKPCRLHKIPVDGGEPIFVGDLPEYIGRWTLSPDGKRLALEMGETRGEIWMLQGISGHR